MEKAIEIWLDEELQIIRQRFGGDLTRYDADRLVAETQACVDRLKNPNEVRILGDVRGVKRTDPQMRKNLQEQLRRPNLSKIAIYGGPPLVRVAIKFFALSGTSNKVRHFRSEREALSWLLR